MSKNALALLLVVLCTASLCACGKTYDGTATSETVAETTVIVSETSKEAETEVSTETTTKAEKPSVFTTTPERPSTPSESTTVRKIESPEKIEFDVEIFSVLPLPDLPENTRTKTLWIESREELGQYLKTTYSKTDDPDTNSGYAGFMNSAQKYNDAFFRENSLILVYIVESSGSVSHEIRSLTLSDGSSSGKPYSIRPEINRISPPVQTCDMNYLAVLLTVDKTYNKSNTTLEEPLFLTNGK